MKYASVTSPQPRRASGWRPGALLLAAFVFLLPQCVGSQSATVAALLPSQMSSEARLLARTQYRQALKDLQANRVPEFRAAQKTLSDYVLAPYLDYHYTNKRIDSLTTRQATDFRATYANFPFADRLFNRWLLRLPAKGRWQDYLAHYEPSTNALRQCYYLRSLYRSGERKAALAEVAPLWVHHKSQPKGCDPLFKAWISAGYLTDELIWQRITLALPRNEVTLARYLLTLVQDEKMKRAATALYRAHTRPTTQFKPTNHKADTQLNRTIVSFGLKRLARKDPARANALWKELSGDYSFDKSTRAAIEARLLLESAEEEMFPTPPERPKNVDDSTLVRVAREAVRQQNWGEALHWIDQFSPALRAQPEWQYWRKRSADADLDDLAQLRNYYGFLAAHHTGSDTLLHHEPASVTEEQISQVSEHPGLVRALELYALDDLINARREWLAAFKELDDTQQAAAARLAQQHGWYDQAIIAANAARLHNDLDLRFPNAFTGIYGKASDATDLPASTLLAVTRQESAFQQRARSSANARGLMQLLPETAKRTARKAGLRQPSTQDLYKPAVNIRIASEYLAWLMDRYDQQRPLAFAAYNAGEHRVDRWIKDRKGMPMEVWIETIPFRETRGYVKSVLAFNHLYSKRMNDPMPLLQAHEQTVN